MAVPCCFVHVSTCHTSQVLVHILQQYNSMYVPHNNIILQLDPCTAVPDCDACDSGGYKMQMCKACTSYCCLRRVYAFVQSLPHHYVVSHRRIRVLYVYSYNMYIRTYSDTRMRSIHDVRVLIYCSKCAAFERGAALRRTRGIYLTAWSLSSRYCWWCWWRRGGVY